MVYSYIAINNKGEHIKGTIEGNSEDDVTKLLKSRGVYTIKLKAKRKSILHKDIEFGKIAKREELVFFTRQLAALINAGVTIIDSLYIISEQTQNKRFKKVLKQIEFNLRSGETFSMSLASFPKVFPVMVINMVKAGEMSGALDESLHSVATYLEKENNTRKKVKSALTYPIAVSIFAIIVTVFLLIKVVPSFVQIYADYGAELPLATRIVIGFSEFLQAYWLIILLFIILVITSLSMLKRNLNVKYYFDYAILKLPIFGKLIQKSAIARLSRTLSSLLKSAVPILQSLTMVSEIIENEAISRPIRESKENLRQGNLLHEPLKNYKVFPPLLIHMMKIGEETGTLEEMLDKVADFYEADVETMTDQLKSLIEPIMIVILTFIVGLILLAILTPMFGVYDLI